MTTKLTALLALLFSISAFSAPAQTNIPSQCQKLFNATEKLLAEAQSQPGTHPQLGKIKNKLNQSKQQILEMEMATQIKSCDQGLAKLHRLNQEELN